MRSLGAKRLVILLHDPRQHMHMLELTSCEYDDKCHDRCGMIRTYCCQNMIRQQFSPEPNIENNLAEFFKSDLLDCLFKFRDCFGQCRIVVHDYTPIKLFVAGLV